MIVDRSAPLAYLLTFRTYGTWLHGDERGSVDDDHNVPGTPLLSPSHEVRRRNRVKMKAKPMVFGEMMRTVVDEAIMDHCRYRGWILLERAVRTNHVHIVVEYAVLQPEQMIRQMKSRATRWLRERGLVTTDQRIWADRPGSRRYLWKPDQVDAAISYVRYGQDERH